MPKPYLCVDSMFTANHNYKKSFIKVSKRNREGRILFLHLAGIPGFMNRCQSLSPFEELV